jgi:ankyrin repeat protein
MDALPRLYREDGAVSAAFVLACRNGHTDAARFLLDRGADVDARGFLGATGLHWAAHNGHADAVRFLLAAGADPTLHDTRFDSDALGWAREGGHEPVVALLMQ